MAKDENGSLEHPAPPSDRSLLRRYRIGSQDAATQLYQRYVERLRALTRAKCPTALARTVDADDIVQSVFASFFQKAGAGEYDVPAGEELWKLFLVMALNKIRAKSNYWLADKRDIRLTLGGDSLRENESAVQSKIAADAEESFLQVVIDEALESLPAGHRPIIRLRTEGYEVAEIAAKLHRAQRTVERVLQNFRSRMADLLGHD